jgi:hypothetical protein
VGLRLIKTYLKTPTFMDVCKLGTIIIFFQTKPQKNTKQIQLAIDGQIYMCDEGMYVDLYTFY